MEHNPKSVAVGCRMAARVVYGFPRGRRLLEEISGFLESCALEIESGCRPVLKFEEGWLRDRDQMRFGFARNAT